MLGRIFGKLTVLEQVSSDKWGHKRWQCSCQCGNRSIHLGYNLSSGDAQSCGCSQGFRTHGKTLSRTYKSWEAMKARCSNPRIPDYQYYGARGISYVPRWEKFENFFADMGERPVGTSIDRIDNCKGYAPENCRWATPKEQMNNQTRSK